MMLTFQLVDDDVSCTYLDNTSKEEEIFGRDKTGPVPGMTFVK